MVGSDSIHVCTLRKETTKEENSCFHSLSLSSSSSLLFLSHFTCLVDQNRFNLTWKTNLCGIANAKQRTKNVTDIYGYFMELAVGLETFIFKDKDDFEDEVFGGFLKR